jgi:hypothetical protein
LIQPGHLTSDDFEFGLLEAIESCPGFPLRQSVWFQDHEGCFHSFYATNNFWHGVN